MELVFPAGGAAPNGHYSPAIVHGGLAFLSMQLPLASSGTVNSGKIEEQAAEVIANCGLILEAAGSSLAHVLSVTISLTDIGDWARVDQVFSRWFGTHRPARGVTSVLALHLNAKVGMQMVAAVSEPASP